MNQEENRRYDIMDGGDNLDEMREKFFYVWDDPESIRYMAEPPVYLQLAAVRRLPDSLRFIENPDPAVQFEAVCGGWWAIAYIEEPSEEIIDIAMRQNPEGTLELLSFAELFEDDGLEIKEKYANAYEQPIYDSRYHEMALYLFRSAEPYAD